MAFRKTEGRSRMRNEAAYDDHDDPALAAYNHYLAWLNANPDRTPADYPGLPVKQSTPRPMRAAFSNVSGDENSLGCLVSE